MAAFKIDLDFELFHLRNIAIAQYVTLKVLISRDREAQTMVLGRVDPDYLVAPFEKFLFQEMAAMVRSQGFVDLDQVRQRLVEFASSGSPEFVQGCLANFDQILSLQPTPEHVEKALQIIEYNRARDKALRLMDQLWAMCRAEEGHVPSDFQHWLEELGWTERDVREVTQHFRDRGEKEVRFWSRLRRFDESVVQQMTQLLRTMGAF